MATWLDLFGIKTKKITRSDDIFLDAVKQHQDIWSEIFSDKLNCIVVCPSSSALGEETMTREFIMTHILLSDRKAGDFINLFGQKLHLIGNDFHCGIGFSEPRKVKIITIETISDSLGKSASIYRINRPFVGGISSPEEPDEVTYSIMHKFVAMLRTFPEAEAVFNYIDKYTQEVNFVGQQSVDGYNKIKPSLKSSLEIQWIKCTERLCHTGTLTAGLGSDPNTTRQIVGQVVESYIMSAIGSSVYQWICRQLVIETGQLLSCAAALQNYTQTDLGIRPELQCPMNEAVKILRTLPEGLTPMDKLIVLKKTVAKIRETVDRNVHSKFLNSDVELATDDIINFIIWIIIKASKYYENIYYDIHFAADYHFVPSSKTEIGFSLNHFQVALSWIIGHGTQERLKDDELDYKSDDITSHEYSSIRPVGLLNQSSDGILQPGICIVAANAIENFINSERPNYFSSSDMEAIYKSVEYVQEKYVQEVEGSSSNTNKNSHYMDTWSTDSSPTSSQYHSHQKRITTAVPIITPRSDIISYSIVNESSYSTSIVIIDHDLSQHLPQYSSNKMEKEKEIISSGDSNIGNEYKIISEESNKQMKIKTISCGTGYYMAIDTSSKLYSWGIPDCGRLGHDLSIELDSFLPILNPLQISSIGYDISIKQVSCGKQHTLAVTETGEVFAWGDNRCAQLGITGSILGKSASAIQASYTTTDVAAIMASNPSLVEAIKHERIEVVACGAFHSLCLTSNGAIYSWGRAANGRLGQFSDRHIPEHAVSKPGLVRGPWINMAISVSPNSSIKSSFLSSKSTTMSTTISTTLSPSIQQNMIGGDIRAIVIAASHSHSMAITNQGEVYTWGCGTYGRLGHGSHMDEFIPKMIFAFNRPGIDIVAASCGSGHSLFRTKEGFLFGCGLNKHGQLSPKEISSCRSSYSLDKDCILVPQPILIYSGESKENRSQPRYKLIDQIACGDIHSAVITKDKSFYVWGLHAGNNGSGGNSSINSKNLFNDLTHSLPSNPKQISSNGRNTMVGI